MLSKFWKLALLVILLTIIALTLNAQGQASVEVWTSKQNYYIGETVYIYFKVSVDAYVEVWLEFPDGRLFLIHYGNVAGGVTYYVYGVAGCPAGPRTVIVKAFVNREVVQETTSYNVQLVLKILADVYIYENYTVDVVFKCTPEYTTWSQFYSLCFEGHSSEYYLMLKNYTAYFLGLDSVTLVESGYSNSQRMFYVKCRGGLSVKPSIRKGIIKFEDPLFKEGKGWLDEITVHCERGIISASPTPSSKTGKTIKWINLANPGTGEYVIVSYYYVKVSIVGLPKGVRTMVSLNEKLYGEAGGGEYLIVKIKGGEKGEIIVLEEVRYKDRIFRVKGKPFATVEEEGEITFEYSEMVKLDITSNYNVAVVIDGSETATPVEYWVEPGAEVVVSAPEVYEVGAGERLVFIEWSDGVKTPQRRIRIEESLSLGLRYKRQFYVDVKDPQGAAYGGGWYDEGSIIEIGVKKNVIKIDKDERFIFDSWSGDVRSKEPTIQVRVNAPLTFTAVWRHQYYVDISSKYSEVILTPYSPDGWYDEGTRLVVEIREEKVDDTPFTTVKFAEWVDKTTGTTYKTPRFEITVNRPLKIEAVWNRRLRLFPLIILGSLIAILVIVVAVFLFFKFGRPSIV